MTKDKYFVSMEQKKNIIWIVMDGVRNYPTPNDPERMGKPQIIEEIAKEGVEFTNAVTSAPSTVMSVTAMMTSIPSYYLSRNLEDLQLDKKNFESLGIILEQEGYSVYNVNCSYELRRDYWSEFLRPVDRSFWPKSCKAMVHWNNEPLNKIIFKLLDKGVKEPFFLYVHFNARRDYECNNRVRDLIDRLKEEGLYDKSILVICSDHGMPDCERRDHYKWLQEKGFYFNRHDLIITDDNICTPLVIKYPECPSGKKIDNTVGLIDLTPTLLDINRIPFGVNCTYGRHFRGVSLLPLINGENTDFYSKRKIRTDTRYISQSDRMISIRGTGYKYIFLRDVPSDEKEQFYDLNIDPIETNNLIKSEEPFYIEKIKEYREEYLSQEEDSISYQKDFLSQKFRRKFIRSNNNINFKSINKILLLGSANPGSFKLFFDVISQINPSMEIDILVERDNSLPNKEMLEIGFRNIIFLPSKFNREEFRKSYRNVIESYDLCLVPLTDFRKDREQADSKSTFDKMQMIQPQAPINNRLLKDYREIFHVARQIKAGKKLYINYNMEVFTHPRFFLIYRYLSKVAAKREMYLSRPSEFIHDIKKVFG